MGPARIRDTGYAPGYYRPGEKNSILDIPGLQVGLKTIRDEAAGVHTGVTLIYPRGVELSRKHPSYAAIHCLNGGGEMTSVHFINDWGFTSSPIAITDSMSAGSVYQALAEHSWVISRALGENKETGYAHHGWPVVGETWGAGLNDIAHPRSIVQHDQVVEAVEDAKTRETVAEGATGGGTGMLCMGHKGGTGTSSRLVPGTEGDFVVGVLVQTNYGQLKMLTIGGVPVGKIFEQQKGKDEAEEVPREIATGSEGSIIVCVVTNAPLLPHQLRRLAARASWGVHAVGGHGSAYNSSGDIIIALSTSEACVPQVVMKHEWDRDTQFRRPVETQTVQTVAHNSIDALFVATAEATEEAILNSICAAQETRGFDGTVWKGLDVGRVEKILRERGVI